MSEARHDLIKRLRSHPNLVAAVLLAAAILLAVSGVADEASQAHADGLFRRALVTFASARALDAVISAAQGTEIALQPAGMGLTLSAGEILDPLNDLVEQFATIVLLAATSLGIQSVGLRISAWWGTTGVLVLAAIAWLWVRRRGAPEPGTVRLTRRFLVVALVVRFALPAVTLTSQWVFDAFLQPEQEAALEVLEQTREDVGALAAAGDREAEAEPGWRDRLRGLFGGDESLGVQERIEAFGERVSRAVEHIVRLIVIFVLQTILLPLLLLWVAVRLAGLIVP